VQKRQRSRPRSLVDQLAAAKARLNACLENARGPKKGLLIDQIRQIDTASRINGWLSSPELRPPRK